MIRMTSRTYKRSRHRQTKRSCSVVALTALLAACAGSGVRHGHMPEQIYGPGESARLTSGTFPLRQAPANDKQGSIDRLFDPNHVIDVRIEMKEEDWDKVRFQDRGGFVNAFMFPADSPFEYARADMTIDGVLVKDVGVRKKGFLGSLDIDRPSLKVKFDEYVDQAPCGDMDRLTLNNNKQDRSRLRQFLAYKLFNETGTAAPRCNYAKVTVNDKYLGIYSNVESAKPPMLERGFGDGSGALFEGALADLFSNRLGRLESKTKASKQEDLRALAELLEEKELDVEKLESMLNIEAFVRFWAMESLIGFWDGYTLNQNNFFIYQNPANAKYYFIPWGTDSPFTSSAPRIFDRTGIKSVYTQSVLANRLYRTPETRELYRKTLVRFLSTCWNEEALLAEVDRIESLIGDDVLKRKSFRRDAARVRSFIKKRRRVLERELKRWPIPLRTGPREPICIEEIGQAHIRFNTKWYAKSPSKPEKRGEIEIDMTVDGNPVRFRQIGAIVKPDKRNESKVQIELTGRRESDRRKLRLNMSLDKATFRSTQKPVSVFGFLIEGNIIAFVVRAVLNPFSLKFIDGEATFEQAGMEPGAPVKGHLELSIVKIAGGKAPVVSWVEE